MMVSISRPCIPSPVPKMVEVDHSCSAKGVCEYHCTLSHAQASPVRHVCNEPPLDERLSIIGPDKHFSPPKIHKTVFNSVFHIYLNPS